MDIVTLQAAKQASEPRRLVGPRYLKTFRAKLAARATSPVDVIFQGDSKTEGTGAVDPSRRWQALALGKMRAKWQPAGVAGGFGYIPAVYVSSTWAATYSPVLAGGAAAKTTATSNLTFGLGKRSVLLNGTGQTITFTLGPATVFGPITDFDIVYVQGSGQGVFTVTVDGGSPTTVTATNATSVYGQRQRFAGLDRTIAHTIVVTWVSGTVNIEGLFAYDGDTTLGIRGWDSGHHGVSASQISSTNNSPWADIGQVAPALHVYYLGRNDYSGGQATATIAANITAHIAAIRAACTVPPSIVLVVDYADTDVNSGIEPFANFRAALRGVAQADGNIAVLDLWERMGDLHNSTLDPLGILDTDHIHPSNTVGHPMIADALIDLLTGV